MSYPVDLDEYQGQKLTDELNRRKALRAQGLCDYCERPTTQPACKFPIRHQRFPREQFGAPGAPPEPWVIYKRKEQLFWRANGNGYSGNIFSAGLWPEAEAKRIIAGFTAERDDRAIPLSQAVYLGGEAPSPNVRDHFAARVDVGELIERLTEFQVRVFLSEVNSFKLAPHDFGDREVANGRKQIRALLQSAPAPEASGR